MALNGVPRHLSFSLDGKLLSVVYESGVVECFQVDGHELVGTLQAFRRASSVSFTDWGYDPVARQHFFVTPDHCRLHVHRVVYDRAQLQYRLQSEQIQLPANGLDREFTCGSVQYPYAYCGTAAGELCIFDVSQKKFSQLLRYFQGAVVGVKHIDEMSILAASQRGDIITLAGTDNLLVTGEIALDCQITAVAYRPGQILAVCLNGSTLSFQTETVQQSVRKDRVVSAIQKAVAGNYSGELPGQSGYLNTQPAERRFTAASNVEGGEQVAIQRLVAESLSVFQAFPASPLIRTCIMYTEDGRELLVGGTATGMLQVWDKNILVTQLKLQGICQCICTQGQRIYAGFDATVHVLEYLGALTQVGKIPVSPTSAVAAAPHAVAVGCQDGKVFVFEARQLKLLHRITDYGTPITALLFDNVVETILHVATKQGFLTAYDLAQSCQRLKHRVCGNSIQSLCQVDSGRYEVVAAVLDGTVRFFDFDVQEPVQIVKMPPGCVAKGKLEMDLTGNQLVAGGCVMDADEVLLCMAQTQDGWVPAGSQLANGVTIATLKVGRQYVYVTGATGELLVYEWASPQ